MDNYYYQKYLEPEYNFLLVLRKFLMVAVDNLRNHQHKWYRFLQNHKNYYRKNLAVVVEVQAVPEVEVVGVPEVQEEVADLRHSFHSLRHNCYKFQLHYKLGHRKIHHQQVRRVRQVACLKTMAKLHKLHYQMSTLDQLLEVVVVLLGA